MQTVTVDIIDDKALKLLNELEELHLIHVRHEEKKSLWNVSKIAKLKGAMTKQSQKEIDDQLNELRNSWE